MRGVQRPGDLADTSTASPGSWPRASTGRQIVPVHEAHVDVEPPADLAVVMDRDHVRRPQPGGHSDSARNRARKSGSASQAGEAPSARPPLRAVSKARYTSPIPPRPINPSMRYGPKYLAATGEPFRLDTGGTKPRG